MKKIRITVNGKVYDCVVEVLEDDEQGVSAVRAEAPSPPPPAPAAAPKAAPAAAIGNGGSKGEGNEVRSPLGGTVQKVFVAPGASIEEKAPMVLLDAMKMDTYIYAPRSGVVAEVCANVGDTVQVGQVLVRYRS